MTDKKNFYLVNTTTNETRLLAAGVETQQEAGRIQHAILTYTGYKSYYSRIWYDELNNMWTDFGHYNLFFVWGNLDV